jgi:DNA repair protein RadC
MRFSRLLRGPTGGATGGAAGGHVQLRPGVAETQAMAPSPSVGEAATASDVVSSVGQPIDPLGFTAGPQALPRPQPLEGPSGHRARIFERLIERGTHTLGDALADYELLEMLLYLAKIEDDARPLAKAAISRFGSFACLLTAPTRDLLATPGFGRTTVATIRLVQASAVRLARAEILERPILDNWDRLMSYLHTVMAREKVEQFRVLFLDNRNRLLADEAQSRGTVNHTPVYPREVVKRAIELQATALILVHNHPSGDPAPSTEDVEMTRQVKVAAAVLSIVLHDHIIVGNGRWLSFRKEHLL